MTLDEWLSKLYKADREGKQDARIEFLAALASDVALTMAAKARLKELDALVEARGEGACAYSTKYRSFLHAALE